MYILNQKKQKGHTVYDESKRKISRHLFHKKHKEIHFFIGNKCCEICLFFHFSEGLEQVEEGERMSKTD